MYDLAHNLNGDPFEPPEHAAAWRVKRMKARGAPDPVFGSDGLPLVLPLDAAPEDVRRSVTEAGRYRLDPIDENNRQIEGGQSGYLYVYPHHLRNSAGANGTNEPEGRDRRDAPSTVGGMEAAFIEMAKVVTTMAQTVVQAMTQQFPAMLESAAVLVRAADGAGLPARQPIAIPAPDQDDEDDDDDQEPPPPPPPPAPGPDLATVIAQALPMVMATFASKNAAPSAAPERAAVADSPAALSHFRAIQQALTPPERRLSQALVEELAPEDLRTWLGELATLPLPAAVERVKALLHSEPAKAPASTAPAPEAPPVPGGSAQPTPPPAVPTVPPAVPTAPPTVPTMPPALSAVPPAAMAHLFAIQQALTPHERALAQALVEELAPDDLLAWLTELSAMPLPVAIERVKALLHSEPTQAAPPKGSGTPGGAS